MSSRRSTDAYQRLSFDSILFRDWCWWLMRLICRASFARLDESCKKCSETNAEKMCRRHQNQLIGETKRREKSTAIKLNLTKSSLFGSMKCETPFRFFFFCSNLESISINSIFQDQRKKIQCDFTNETTRHLLHKRNRSFFSFALHLMSFSFFKKSSLIGRPWNSHVICLQLSKA